MKILVTGSHFTPAQAVIEQFLTGPKNADPKIKVVYLGRSSTMEGDKTPSAESQILPKLGVKFIPFNAGRLQLFSWPKIPLGFIQACYYLLLEKPDIVLSFGGYVAVPVVIVAWLMRIPVVIHEQTLVTGMSNKISSWFADKICVSFERQYDLNMDKVVVTGNPIRQELLSPDIKDLDPRLNRWLVTQANSKLPLILVTGGNQGAHAINQNVAEILDELITVAYVIHQTGDSKYKDHEALQEKIKHFTNQERYYSSKFLNVSEMGYVMQRADLAISRAGVNTLLELSYFQLPTVTIPISGHFEQRTNGLYFQQLGLCVMIPPEALTAKKLLLTVKESLKNIKPFKVRANIVKEVVQLDAAKRVALETLSLYQSNQAR